jgi:competence protein ComEC
VFLVEQETPSGSVTLKTLVTGDVELAAQAHLARNWPLLTPIDIYKVPHHGSRIQDERLAKLAGAKHAVISVGADNDFGHPNAETLASLSEAGMQVHRTDLSGDIAFSYRHGELIATSRG